MSQVVTASTDKTIPRTYGNWRRPVSAGILGLGAVGTAILIAGMILVVLVMMTRGIFWALGVAVGVAVLLLAMMKKDSHGKNLVTRVTAKSAFAVQRVRGSNVYRSGPTGRSPWGTNQLPGLGASLKLSEHRDGYDRPFAMIEAPSTATFSIVIGAEPSGATLVDVEEADRWVADWGHWLARLADETSLESASVTIETSPDAGGRLRREVQLNIDDSAPPFAQEVLRQTVQQYPAGSSTVKAYIAITFNAATRVGGRKRKANEVARDLASRLPGLTQTLQMTGAGAAHPVTAQELCEVVRVAYDPAAAALFDEARGLGQTAEITWTNVGPSAAQANWASYRHDSGHSITWSMTEAPRGIVQSGILTRLLSPHRDIVRKRVTLLYRPVSAARAAAIVEADLSAANFRATTGNRAKARDSVSLRSAEATAQEEASGAGLVNFGMLVTATVASPASEPDAIAAVDGLSAAARIRLRPVYGSQDSAFAAALPLGLVLSKHIKVPAQLRNNV